LTVNGSRFVSGAGVLWNGSALSTTFVSATQLEASVPACRISFAGSASVMATNPDGTASNVVNFAINPSAAQSAVLVGWWRFGEISGTAVADSSGCGNNGTLTGTFSRVQGQVSPDAIFFAGTSYVNNNQPGVGFPTGTTPRTLTAWIKLPAKLATTAQILEQQDGYNMYINSGVLESGITGITRVDDGAWHHVVSVYNGPGANWSLYVDGQLDQVGTATDPSNTSPVNWRIGQSLNGTSSFPGIIDEVRYYNRALSTSEIQAIVIGDGGKLAPAPVSVSQMSNITTCTPNPGITKMNYGDVSNCSVGVVGETQTFQFQGNAGDMVWFNVLRTSTNSIHCYQVTDPDGIQGSLTCVPYNFFGNAQDLVQEQFLTKPGTYTIQVSGQAATFPFSLGLKRETPLPQQIPQLTFGRAAQAELITPFDWHYYSVNGTAGDKVSVTLNRTTTNAQHCLSIYAPSGEVAFDQCAPYNFFGNPVTVSTTLSLTQSGGYVFRVSDIDNLTAFDYSFTVSCVGTCSNTPVPPPPQVCSYSLSPPSELLSDAAAGGVVGITAPVGCPWTVSSSASFLTITTAASGGGPDTIGFVVGPNTNAAAQTAVITVAGQTSTITQLGTAPLLSVTPNPLVFNVQAGSQTNSNILLNVFTNLTALSFTASATMTLVPALNWLTVSSASGSAPTTIAVTVNASVLPPGTFTGSVTIKASTASPNQIVIPVTVNVPSTGAAVLSVSATPITFSLAVGGSSALVQRTVSNTGAGFLSFTASVDPAYPAAWLTVTPSGGSVSVATPDTLLISASPGSLAAGTYGSDILVSGNGTVVHIPVTMTIGPAGAQILLSQVGLSFIGVAGAGNPSPQTFGILNSGVGSLDWTAAATTLSGGNWLQLNTTSGTVNRPLLDVSLLTVSVNISALSPGDYYGKIVIAGDALNSGQLVTVLCSVLPSGSDPGPEVRPSGLIFIGPPGGKPAPQPVGITNLIAQSVSFTSTPLTLDGAKWLGQSPVNATVAPNVPGTMNVQSDDTNLPAGVLRGVVTLLFQDGTSTNVNVLNVVAAGASAGGSAVGETAWLALHPRASSCSSPNLEVQFISFQTGFQATLGKPATVSVKVVDDCGNPLVPASGAGTSVTASFSNGDPGLTLVSEGGGQWSGTWIPSQLPASGTAAIVTVHAAFVSLGSQVTLQTGTNQVTGTLLSGTAPSSGSAINMASLALSAPAGAGSLISIFGTNMASQSGTAPSLPLPTDIEGTEVLLGGVSLPLLYSSAGQINAQIPYDISPNTQQQLVVQSGGAVSVPVLYSVAAAQPGIFTQNLQGTGQGVILDSGELRYAEPGTPAARGETVVIYCTGLGAVTPAVQPGAPAPYPFATAVNPVSVSIGGVSAQVTFAGLTPGYAGLYQVNAVVPAGVAVGNAVPVTVTVAGQASNVVTMAVQ
jgi:uncharacterized protein (TIGR03437 family)